MPSFLKQVVDDLLVRFNGKIDHVTMVFPSRRAGLFFQKYLSERIEKPIWMPQLVSIGDIMHKISGLRKAEPISLIAKLFKIFNEIKGGNEQFDSFYFWGEVMLADFDQVDKYRVDALKLYANVKDIKEIEERFGGLTPEQSEVIRNFLGIITDSHESKLRDNYLTIWRILGQMYSMFSSELVSEGFCYEGLAFRRAANILSSGSALKEVPNPIAFIGFNALNACEHELFRYCKKEKSALFYWDYDPVFIENKIHEAGMFIRENLLLYPNAISPQIIQSSSNKDKEISVIAAPSTVTQAKLIPQILADVQQKGGSLNESTAIVFPRENLLIPTLQSIPPEVEQLNITMGYPLKETPAYSLAESLVRLQINKRMGDDRILSFYHKDVLSLLNHPYVRACEPDKSKDLVGLIKQRNLFYTQQSMLAESSFLGLVFTDVDSSKLLPDYILKVCTNIALNLSGAESDHSRSNVDLEFLFALHKSIKRLNEVVKTLNFEISPRIFLQLFRKVFVQERVSFTGEPLAGLQLMGFLETRALDFDNLVVLSFNDDIIPGRNNPVSFITPSLRFAYGLPDHRHHDAVYAYYFYRLLHRAKRTYLVYSSRTEGMSSGERSRFALQLEYEQMIGRIKTIPITFNFDLAPQTPILVEKSEQVMNSLIANLSKEKGITLSPSGLTTYLTCSLRFYFRYGVGLYEPDEITEEVGAQEFGSIIHGVMEQLYKPKEGNTVTAEFLTGLLKEKSIIEQTVDKVFARIYLKGESHLVLEKLSGRNILARNAIIYSVKRIVNIDLKRVPFNLVRHEKQINYELPVPLSGNINKVMLGGIIDRLESRDNTLWIIDYKTGNAKDKGKFIDISELFDSKRIDKVKEVFQIFCYSLAATSEYKNMTIKPGLWFIKALKPGDQPRVKVKIDSKNFMDVDDFIPYKDDFETGLQNLVHEIFDTSLPFTQTDKIERCKTCPYIGICGRD